MPRLPKKPLTDGEREQIRKAWSLVYPFEVISVDSEGNASHRKPEKRRGVESQQAVSSVTKPQESEGILSRIMRETREGKREIKPAPGALED